MDNTLKNTKGSLCGGLFWAYVILILVFTFTHIAGCSSSSSPTEKPKKRANLDFVLVLDTSLEPQDLNQVKEILNPFKVADSNIFFVLPDKVEIHKLDCTSKKSIYTIDWQTWFYKLLKLSGRVSNKNILTYWEDAVTKLKIEEINKVCKKEESKPEDIDRLRNLLANRDAFLVLSRNPQLDKFWSQGSLRPTVFSDAKTLWEDVYKKYQEGKKDKKFSIVIGYTTRPQTIAQREIPRPPPITTGKEPIIIPPPPLPSRAPTIVIQRTPDIPPGENSRGKISGEVKGIRNPSNYKVVIFAKVENRDTVWYIQPNENNYYTEIQANGIWSNQTHGGHTFIALLVDEKRFINNVTRTQKRPSIIWQGVIAVSEEKTGYTGDKEK